MVDTLKNLLIELERFGRDNDKATPGRPSEMFNITRDTGEFLAVLVRAASAKTDIQMSLKLWIPGRARYHQLARNDDSILVRTSVP
jgi:hypothetical protein